MTERHIIIKSLIGSLLLSFKLAKLKKIVAKAFGKQIFGTLKDEVVAGLTAKCIESPALIKEVFLHLEEQEKISFISMLIGDSFEYYDTFDEITGLTSLWGLRRSLAQAILEEVDLKTVIDFCRNTLVIEEDPTQISRDVIIEIIKQKYTHPAFFQHWDTALADLFFPSIGSSKDLTQKLISIYAKSNQETNLLLFKPETSILPLEKSAYKTISCTLLEVLDGDTIRVANKEGFMFDVRLIGIDAPEVSESSKCKRELKTLEISLAEMQKMGEKATAFLKSIISKDLKLVCGYENGVIIKDYYKRVLGYVVTDKGVELGAEMIKNGYALVFPWHGKSIRFAHPFMDKYIGLCQAGLTDLVGVRKGYTCRAAQNILSGKTLEEGFCLENCRPEA